MPKERCSDFSNLYAAELGGVIDITPQYSISGITFGASDVLEAIYEIEHNCAVGSLQTAYGPSCMNRG